LDKEFASLDEPSIGRFAEYRTAFTLRVEPSQQRMMNHARRIADAAPFEADLGADHALGSEERPLRVVRDRPQTTVSRRKILNAGRPKGSEDLCGRHELDRSHECVAHRAAEEAATNAGCPTEIALHMGRTELGWW
jgi:hypothetical protein